MSTNRLYAKTVLRQGSTLSFIDPLAQSFIIETPSILTSAYLYFSAKDDILPIKIDIRKMVNGTPSSIVIPNSEAIVDAANIQISANSSTPTIFRFSDPVYLEPGEYALTIGSDSRKTRIWVSQLGETDVVTGQVIQKQPYFGVLFKSQNGSTWTPDQLQDLKFNLYRAKFTVGQTSTIDFITDDLSQNMGRLPYNPLEVSPKSSTMKVYHTDHGMSEGSVVVLSSIGDHQILSNIQYFGLYPANITGYRQVISNVTADSYTVNLPYAVNSNVTAITRFGKSVVGSGDLKFTDIYPIMAIIDDSASTISHKVRLTNENYTRDADFISVLPNKDLNLDSVKVLPSGTNNEVKMSNAVPLIYRMEVTPNSEYTAPIIDFSKASILLYKNRINNPTYDNLNLLASERRLISLGNTTSFTNISSSTGTIDLANTNARANAVSMQIGSIITILGSNNTGNVRVLEIQNSGANILVSGTIATEQANASASSNVVIYNGVNYIPEEAATGGSALARYITRQLNFINPSTAFKLFLDVAKPFNTYLKIYYRISLVGDTSSLATKEYTEITNVTIRDSLGGEFYEIEKLVENLQSFDGIQLKIVFLSDDITKVPRCKNLRLVAVA